MQSGKPLGIEQDTEDTKDFQNGAFVADVIITGNSYLIEKNLFFPSFSLAILFSCQIVSIF